MLNAPIFTDWCVFYVTRNKQLIKLSWLVCVFRRELYGASADAFIGSHVADECYSEVFIWSSSESSQVVVLTCFHEVPCVEVS